MSSVWFAAEPKKSGYDASSPELFFAALHPTKPHDILTDGFAAESELEALISIM